MSKVKHSSFFKGISVVLSIFLCLQGSTILSSQTAANIETQIEKTKKELKANQLNNALKRLLRLVNFIENKGTLIKGKTYVLLGICYEKKNENDKAKGYYKKGHRLLDHDDLAFVDDLAEGLVIYNKYFEREEEPATNVIAKEKKDRKKKFPWLLVAGGVVAASIVIIVLLKKKKKEYTLTVTRAEGVEGNPDSGFYNYKEGESVNYSYSLRSGYSNLIVQLDGSEVSSSGTVEMNRNHTLTATATPNEVNFITDKDNVEIDEGGTSTFNVRLSAQPTGDVNVTVIQVSGDSDISVLSGSNLIFTTSNWNLEQIVTLQAAEDADTTNGQASIQISGGGITAKTITAAEQDNDINLPTVSIVKPGNGDTVSGTVTIKAVASGEIGISKVEFYIDGKLIDTDASSPYKCNWDTTSYSESTHVIRVVAYDTLNQASDPYEIEVIVKNEEEECRITITYPNSTTVWTAGESYWVTWDKIGAAREGAIQLYDYRTMPPQPVSELYGPGTTGSFLFPVPKSIPEGTDYRIGIFYFCGEQYLATGSDKFQIKH